jgi:hypothetical protein
VTARIDSRTWRSSYFPDSLVAFYDSTTGWLQIIGQEVGPGIWSTLLAVVPSGASIGSYHLTGNPTGRIALWTAGQYRSYISSGLPGDSLRIEELDIAGRTVRGSVRFVGAPLFPDRSQFSVIVEARFVGTLRMVPSQ